MVILIMQFTGTVSGMAYVLCHHSMCAVTVNAKDVICCYAGQVNTSRRQLGMRVFGFDTPKPVQTFGQCGFDAQLMAAIKKAG